MEKDEDEEEPDEARSERELSHGRYESNRVSCEDTASSEA